MHQNAPFSAQKSYPLVAFGASILALRRRSTVASSTTSHISHCPKSPPLKILDPPLGIHYRKFATTSQTRRYTTLSCEILMSEN